MAAKRIYQIAKEIERDEKEIIEFLTAQGIKVSNRLSAVSEETYNFLKAKYTAPPEPEPEPEPVPEPVVEQPAQSEQSDAPAEEVPAPAKKKKKKKKRKAQQADEIEEDDLQEEDVQDGQGVVQTVIGDGLNAATRAVYREAIASGNEFIKNYSMGWTKKQIKASKPKLSNDTDGWGVLHELKIDYPDTSPVRYWKALNKLSTRAFKLMNEYGLVHREILAELRDLTADIGKEYEPREIFTDEENQLFAEQQKMFFRIFGHGMGTVNDNLFALKMHAERMKAKYEFMDFVAYVTDSDDALRSQNRVPFAEMVDSVVFSISGVVRRTRFYKDNKAHVVSVIKNLFEWREGYAALKEQGASADKLEKYLALEKKFVDLAEFFAFDNLLFPKIKKALTPFETALNLLNEYRDNLDDPDAERNFKYKVRGITNVTFKPKEYIFLYQFAELERGKDYRPPEEISADE